MEEQTVGNLATTQISHDATQTQSNCGEDEPLDALARLIAQHCAKNPQETETRRRSSDLVEQLPEPYTHDDDGFAHSFIVDEADKIHTFFDKYV
mmetsp:Transcript_14585/g.26356  ORF Transcript_14585/g.26356 Transcript_14585/m.26356 type:complete len:94 (-) Transcript_14585:1507-1788(-)